MAYFPTSPTNGQTATVNGIVYTYDDAKTVWKRAVSSLNNLTVSGNITAAGNIIGANVTATDNIYVTSGIYWAGNGEIFNSGITYTASTSPIAGRVGDQWFDTSDGTLYEYMDDGDSFQWVDIQTPTFTSTAAVTGLSGNVSTTGNISASSIVITGGIYWANGVAFVSSTYSNANVTAFIGANIGTLFVGNARTNANLGAFQSYANTKIGTNTNSNLVVVATTTSTSTTTGALVVRGGAGVAGNITIGGSVTVAGTLSGGVGYLLERANVVTGSAPAVSNIDVLYAPVMYWTGNNSANVTANIRGNSIASLNSVMAVNQTATVAMFLPVGSTPYFVNTVKIDNTTVTPVWLNGNTVVSGNANSIDVYTFTIIKTASATYRVFATQSMFQHTG